MALSDMSQPSSESSPFAAVADADAGAAGALATWRRAHLAVILSFAVIVGNALLQAWQTQRIANARSVDAEVIAEAGRHDTLAQRLGRLAAQVAAAPDPSSRASHQLSAELARSKEDALRLRSTSERIDRSHADRSPVDTALEHWEQVRERLWYRAESLLAHVDAQRLHLIGDASDAIQHEADQAARAAHAAAQAVQAHSRELGAFAFRRAGIGAAITIALLLVLSVVVVSPSFRALRQQARRLAQQAAENRRLAVVAEHTGSLVVITDRQRRIVWVNDAFTRTTGWELHEAAGRSPGELLQCPQTDAAEVARIRRALDDGQAVRSELLNRSRDGREYWIDADIQPLRGADGGLVGHIAVESVITEQVTQRLRSAALLAALPTAVVVHDREGLVIEANPAARELLGTRPGDPADALLRRMPLDDSLEPLERDELPVVRSLRTTRGGRGQVLAVDDERGGRLWLLASTEPLTDSLGAPDGVVACYVDMTERRRLLEQMRDAERRDALTRMPNRSVVLERVQRAIEHRRRHAEYGFAVLFMDVDRFKQVNDSYGHGAGDELLRQFAARLEFLLRPGDAIGRIGSELRTAARIGGDEFVVVLEGMRCSDDACQVAERLVHELSRPYPLGSDSVHVSVSIGIVTAEQANADAETVLRDCDIAMYEAKRAGRGCWVLFDASMHERVRTALEMEGELRRALAEDELYVVYQPVVELPGQRLRGVEALVRWRHPTRGEIPPGRFVGLAEECGLIDAIGDTVLAKACGQFAAWQRRWADHAPRLMAVNLSRAQLRQPGLVPEIRAVLEASGMRPEQLQLEVTESFAAQDAQVRSTLRALKAVGIRLALDDFGTGYSSLACLHQLPVDTVKIDRSFVAQARELEYHRVLISATIRVARTLGMTTVAEGIETEDQAELMASLQCDRGQGFLFGRPMKPEDFDRWLEGRTSDSVV